MLSNRCPSFPPPLLASPKCKLIVCQMSSTRCPTLNWLLLPLFLVVTTVSVGAAASHLESLLLHGLTAAFTLAHIHYGVQVVSNGGRAERADRLWGDCRGGWLSVRARRWRRQAPKVSVTCKCVISDAFLTIIPTTNYF